MAQQPSRTSSIASYRLANSAKQNFESTSTNSNQSTLNPPNQSRNTTAHAAPRARSRSARVRSVRVNKPQNLLTTNHYVCSGCNKLILKDKYLLKACNKYWHENCLKCDRCKCRLGEIGSTLYDKSNFILCRQDYIDMFGKTGICSRCDKLIPAIELVMKAKDNVYHLECFSCQLCNQRFCVGDRFYLCDNKIVCQYDYDEHFLPLLDINLAAEQPTPLDHLIMETSSTVHINDQNQQIQESRYLTESDLIFNSSQSSSSAMISEIKTGQNLVNDVDSNSIDQVQSGEERDGHSHELNASIYKCESIVAYSSSSLTPISSSKDSSYITSLTVTIDTDESGDKECGHTDNRKDEAVEEEDQQTED